MSCGELFHGDGFGEVARLVYVAAAAKMGHPPHLSRDQAAAKMPPPAA